VLRRGVAGSERPTNVMQSQPVHPAACADNSRAETRAAASREDERESRTMQRLVRQGHRLSVAPIISNGVVVRFEDGRVQCGLCRSDPATRPRPLAGVWTEVHPTTGHGR
jgi:hypothetical protein